MWGQRFANLLLVAELTSSSHALPGLQARGCANKVDGVYQDPCGDAVSTVAGLVATASTNGNPSSITSGPSLIAQAYRRNAESVTVACGTSECSFFDVSSSLITVMPLSDVTSARGPPFNNGTGTTQPHIGPTASGTGISATPSEGLNSTTTITRRVTMSVTTVTAGNWSDWTSTPIGAGAGTSQRPHNSANATNSPPSRWSVWSMPMSTGNTHRPLPTATNSTYVSSGRTFTRAPVSPPRSSCSPDETTCSTSAISVSYVATDTYVFAGSTVIIPIPAGFGTSTTSTSKHTAKSTSSSLVGGRISTSSCWTTTGGSTTGTRTATITASSKICWILSCDEDDNCTDHVSRYPITVDAQSTSPMASHMNNTVMATTSTSSNGSVFATVAPSSTHDTMWMTWSASRSATVKSSSSPSKSRSTSAHSTTRNRPVDATTASVSTSSSMFESTYNPWMGWMSTLGTISTRSSTSSAFVADPNVSVDGTITRTVSPLPATSTTSETSFHARVAMMNRKRYLAGQQRKSGHEKEVEEEFETGEVDV